MPGWALFVLGAVLGMPAGAVLLVAATWAWVLLNGQP
jgi:hypothetical protein